MSGQLPLQLRNRVMRRAELSGDGVYRTLLEISICDLELYEIPVTSFVTWIMLNPSTADAFVDDPTIRKCIGFSSRWGFSGIRVVNLYSFRTPYPAELARAHRAGIDVVGEGNDRAIRHAITNCGRVIPAWGKPGPRPERASRVAAIAVESAVVLHAIGVNKCGNPKHPLMPSYASVLTPWSP